MIPPSGFIPSNANRARFYDEEGRLKEFRPGTQGGESDEGAIAEANSLFATDAELFGSISPFLKVNKIRDAKRRNYIIQPGGACIYFEADKELKDPYGGGRVQFTGPSDKESFGPTSLDGTKMAEPNGRAFTLGNPSFGKGI